MSTTCRPTDAHLVASLLATLPSVRHAFTTAFDAQGRRLDLGPAKGRSRETVEDAWRRALEPLDAPTESLVLLSQVHGARVLVAERGLGPHRVLGEADAVVSTIPGVVLAVRVADCVPILLTGGGGVAAVHAGWRGIVAGVVPAAVQALRRETGCEPEQITAAIGPHAGVASYETGPAVVDALVGAGLPRSAVAWAGPGGREHADLGAAVTAQLQRSGVDRVERIERCTIADGRLHSHRRDGSHAGRQAAIIGLIG